MRLSFKFAIALSLITLAIPLRAADDETMKPDGETMVKTSPTTRPTSRPGFRNANAGAPGGMLERLRENANQLGLSDSQKEQIQKLSQSSRDRIRQIMEDANGDRDKARSQITDLMRSTFEQIRDILTPDQQRKMREILAGKEGFRTPNGGKNQDNMEPAEAKKHVPAKSGRVASTRPASTQPVDLSTLTLKKLDGKPLFASSLKGKPTVLIFGSYTCPNFRQNAKALDDLARKYGVKASFVMVYTKEAHPTGGWEVQRNKDAEIAVSQHSDEAARIAAAKQAKAKLGLTMAMVIDSMDDQASASYNAFPNGAIILDRSGSVKARQNWAEPRTLKVLLDEILLTNPNIPAE